MKIAFITDPGGHIVPEKQAGSLPVWTFEVARRLARTHQVTVFEAGKHEGQRQRSVEGVLLREVSVGRDLPVYRSLRHRNLFRRVETRLKGLIFKTPKSFFGSPFFHSFFILKTAFELRKGQFDFAHIMNFPQFVPVIRALNPGLPIALHMQSDWLTVFDRKRTLKRIFKADFIIGCSDYITRRVQAAFPEVAMRCHTVYNGADVESFEKIERRPPLPGNPAIVMFAGRVAPVKGVHTLIEAFAKVVREYPDVRLRIIGKVAPAPAEDMIGAANDPKVKELSRYYKSDYPTVLTRLVTEAIQDKVEFVGLIPNRSLGEEYASADIMVAPSIWPEPFGMIIPEAMAVGTPVIATRGGGIPEIIEDGVSGLLVERGDVDALSKAILSLLLDPGRRRAMGMAARERAKQFAWDNTVNSLVEVLPSILGRQSPNGADDQTIQLNHRAEVPISNP